MGMGHSGAALGVMALVLSTALLVWVGGCQGNPHQKAGKFIAWIAIILSALIVAGSVFVCASAMCGGMCGRTKGESGMMRGMPPGMMRGMMPPGHEMMMEGKMKAPEGEPQGEKK